MRRIVNMSKFDRGVYNNSQVGVSRYKIVSFAGIFCFGRQGQTGHIDDSRQFCSGFVYFRHNE